MYDIPMKLVAFLKFLLCKYTKTHSLRGLYPKKMTSHKNWNGESGWSKPLFLGYYECPLLAGKTNLLVFRRFHGINERISKKNYEELVMFYFSLIQNCDIQKLPEPHSSVHEL